MVGATCLLEVQTDVTQDPVSYVTRTRTRFLVGSVTVQTDSLESRRPGVSIHEPKVFLISRKSRSS